MRIVQHPSFRLAAWRSAWGRPAGKALALAAAFACATPADDGPVPSPSALAAAEHAQRSYAEATVTTLAELVAFRTVHDPGIPDNRDHPEFQGLVGYLRDKADALGFDFADYGALVVLGLGESDERLGIVTHGDVQPADASKWAGDPFVLDAESEPGLLVGRGAEDDKGPLAAALWAMKAVADQRTPLRRRLELVVSLTEESDWEPFKAALEAYSPPPLNLGFDARYPVVTAEKGWGEIHVAFAPVPEEDLAGTPRLVSFAGGSFLSQVPEECEAVIRSPTPRLEAELRAAIASLPELEVEMRRDGDALVLSARGRAAHSMDPEDGLNAITHLADLLKRWEWPDTRAARVVRLINDLVGTGDYAERFGDLAHEDEFMGRLTLTLATVRQEGENLEASASFRRPVGRTAAAVEASVRGAVAAWQEATGIEALETRVLVTEPYRVEGAPHVPILLDVYRHFTGDAEARAISIGGGTNARLVPYGVNFGPSMPGTVYTGHSEHEFIRREQLLLDLRMYAAALYELATRELPIY